jgi:hypothetical protein
MNDDKLMQSAAKLSQEISPERDLWAGIEEAIEKPQRRRWTPMLAQAAAVVLLVGASSAITYVTVKDDGPEMVVASPNMIFERASFGNRYNLGPDFQDARNGLVADLDAELERLSPTARQNVEENLTVLRSAINEMNAELEKDPENIDLQERLMKAYRDELSILRRVSSLSRNVMMRNDI